MNCDQCEALMIQGVFCHETGCPNESSRYEDGEWIRQRKCWECGLVLDADQACCEFPPAEDYSDNFSDEEEEN